MNDFLPEGYKAPSSGYMKLQEGENTFRVMSSAIVGYEYWNNAGKPIRSKTPFKTTPDIKIKDGKPEQVRHFWAFVVWNYQTSAIEILEITQSSIKDGIQNLVSDKDWGNPRAYDIKINKTGSGLSTEYSVSPKPHKEVESEILQAFSDKKINLNKLYDGGNPFE